MKRLTEIGIRTGADKATDHLFTEFYDEVFSQYDSPRILEVGVHMGASINMYLEYFKSPYVVGMDIQQKVDTANKWKFVLGDQTNIHDLSKCVEKEPFDIIIDDGGHTMRQQQITFGYLLNYVKSGGYYILEDLHTSFHPEYIETDAQYTSYEMLQRIQAGETYFSNYLSQEEHSKIVDRIERVELWHKIPGDASQSVTSIIKVK